MFHGMGHAGHPVLIAEVANVDIEGGTGLVCLGIMDQESLEAIV
jgi:hypothetical protein